jgi:DNA-binding transcriptional regulator YdaS (Cro superfamily)
MAQVFRALKRKFGISAPRMSVQAHVPWYWRWLGIVTVGALVAAIGWATYDFGMEFAGFRQSEATHALTRLNEEIGKREAELSQLRSKVAAAERQLQIERATYGDLSKQMKTLSEENAALREDLAFFQSLMPAGAKDTAGVSINRVRVQPEAVPGEYRYRLLLVQTGQRAKEFQGNVQLVVNVEENERKFVVMVPPDAARSAKEYQVNFKFFQRVEGSFKVPSGAVVKSMQVRVFETGASTPKLTQTVTVS